MKKLNEAEQQIYERVIAPQMESLAMLCEQLGIPLLCITQIEVSDDGVAKFGASTACCEAMTKPLQVAIMILRGDADVVTVAMKEEEVEDLISDKDKATIISRMNAGIEGKPVDDDLRSSLIQAGVRPDDLPAVGSDFSFWLDNCDCDKCVARRAAGIKADLSDRIGKLQASWEKN